MGRQSHAEHLHPSVCRWPKENQLSSKRHDGPRAHSHMIVRNCTICWRGFRASELHISVLMSPWCILYFLCLLQISNHHLTYPRGALSGLTISWCLLLSSVSITMVQAFWKHKGPSQKRRQFLLLSCT